MGRPAAVSASDIARAATRLIGQGTRPTVDAVHKEVGHRGSRTTVNNLLRQFLEEFRTRGLGALPAAIPEELVPVIEDFWSHALVKAGERYDAERIQDEKALKALQERLSDSNVAVQERDKLLLDRERVIGQLNAQLEEGQSRLSGLRSVCEGHEVTIVDLKRDKARLLDQLDDERETAARRYDQAQEDWGRERAILERTVADARQKLQEDNATNERLADHWMRQLDDSRQHVSEIKERHHEEKKRWEGDMRLEKARADRFAVSASQMEAQISALQEEVERTSKENRQLQADLELSERRCADQEELSRNLQAKINAASEESKK